MIPIIPGDPYVVDIEDAIDCWYDNGGLIKKVELMGLMRTMLRCQKTQSVLELRRFLRGERGSQLLSSYGLPYVWLEVLLYCFLAF